MKKFLINLISFYQNYLSFDSGILSFLAPGGACKYEVRCSEYTKAAIRDLGAVRGVVMGIKRIWGCR